MRKRRYEKTFMPPAVEMDLLMSLRAMIQGAQDKTLPYVAEREIDQKLLARHDDAVGAMRLRLEAKSDGTIITVVHPYVNSKGVFQPDWLPMQSDPRDAIDGGSRHGFVAPLLAKVADLAPLPLKNTGNLAEPHYNMQRDSAHWRSDNPDDPMQAQLCAMVSLQIHAPPMVLLESLDHCIKLAEKEKSLRQEYGDLPSEAFWPRTRGR